MLRNIMLGAALMGAAGASGCATITRGTSEALVVESEPSGAVVTTSTGLRCDSTPCTFPKVKRDSEFEVTVAKDGYKTTTHRITHQTSGSGGAGMAGNVILGGLIGAVVDANNGATQELVPNPLRVTLETIEPVVAMNAAPAEALPAAPAAEPAAPAAQ